MTSAARLDGHRRAVNRCTDGCCPHYDVYECQERLGDVTRYIALTLAPTVSDRLGLLFNAGGGALSSHSSIRRARCGWLSRVRMTAAPEPPMPGAQPQVVVRGVPRRAALLGGRGDR